MSEDVYMEEFAVEVRKKLADDSDKFVCQLDVFQTLEKAQKFIEEYDEPLDKDEFLSILAIEYDKNENEVGIYFVD